MFKDVKRTIKFYKKNIYSKEYKEYKTKSDLESLKNHRDYINKQKPEWKNRTDYYDKYLISHVIIWDVLSNDGVIKLLKKLYSLPKNRFRVTNYYKKPTIKNKYDYVHLKYLSTSTGRFAEIKFLDDTYIDSIDVSWTQVNNYFAFIEYKIKFRKCLDESLHDEFIYSNINKINKKDYAIWYYVDVKNDFDRFMILEQMNNEYFSIICQHYITNLLYSEKGKKTLLVHMVVTTRKEQIDIDKLYLGDLSKSYFNKKENYVITSDYEERNFLLLAGNNRIPAFGLCGYVARYGNPFYYHFFGKYEIENFENEFSKYFTGRKHIKYNKEFIFLLNKMQSASDKTLFNYEDFKSSFNDNWDYYNANDKINFKEYSHVKIEDYKNIYEKNFSYLKLLSEVNYGKANYINALIATFVSILALILSLLALFIR